MQKRTFLVKACQSFYINYCRIYLIAQGVRESYLDFMMFFCLAEFDTKERQNDNNYKGIMYENESVYPLRQYTCLDLYLLLNKNYLCELNNI